MSEIRYDPLQDRWVIIAPDRSARPSDYSEENGAESTIPCPFCPGKEHQTPPELWAVRESGSRPDGPGWSVRVIPNRFPALNRDKGSAEYQNGILKCLAGYGAHEVIIESPRHGDALADLTRRHLASVLAAFRIRLRVLQQDPRLKYALIFKNYGGQAGASLAHPHSQLIATPVIPQSIRRKLEAARQHTLGTGLCLVCSLIQAEREREIRVIREKAGFIALSPYAARFPFEIFIAPIAHTRDFAAATDMQLECLAEFLQDILKRLKRAADNPPYNLFLNTSPFSPPSPRGKDSDRRPSCGFHWHLEILPRQTSVAGFEWGSGFHINISSPETCAELLRRTRDP
jgi:UDPglucose--hexose-1-phosphate uridylyltransferase